MYSRKSNTELSELGVSYIEVSLSIILFISLVIGVLWYGLALYQRTSLISSIGDALLWGVTRSDLEMFEGTPVVSEIEAYASAGMVGPRMKQLLYQRGLSDTESTSEFNESAVLAYSVRPVFGGASFQTLPSSYSYTLAYMHEFMRVRIGSFGLKYPCDDREGCLGCRFINPASIGNSSIDPMSHARGPYSADVVGLRCTYVISTLGLGPLIGFDDQKIVRTFTINRSRDS